MGYFFSFVFRLSQQCNCCNARAMAVSLFFKATKAKILIGHYTASSYERKYRFMAHFYTDRIYA
jgi:hypothetical protein